MTDAIKTEFRVIVRSGSDRFTANLRRDVVRGAA